MIENKRIEGKSEQNMEKEREEKEKQGRRMQIASICWKRTEMEENVRK